MSRKKNSVLLNEPYKFDANLVLACSNAFSFKKGYKTADTTNFMQTAWKFWIAEGKQSQPEYEGHAKWRSPEPLDRYQKIALSPQCFSERYECANWNNRHLSNNETLEEAQFDSNRDISPYRVENFLEMLNKLGYSDASIMKKITNSPMNHMRFRHEPVSDTQNEISELLARVSLQGDFIEKTKAANYQICWRANVSKRTTTILLLFSILIVKKKPRTQEIYLMLFIFLQISSDGIF